jgi:hypothetical protein
MRMLLVTLVLLSSCSAPGGQTSENSGVHPSGKVSAEQKQSNSGELLAEPIADSDGADTADFPYLAVRKTSGPALQALMRGRLEVQGDCVVFVEPGAAPKLAVFHPPASLKRDSNGAVVVASINFEIPIGREVRVGGGALPPNDDLNATLRAPVADRCPDKAVEIGELVQ